MIDYDLTEKQTRQIVKALKSGRSGGIAELVAKTKPATTHGGAREGAGRKAKELVESAPAAGHDGNQVTNGDLNKPKGAGRKPAEGDGNSSGNLPLEKQRRKKDNGNADPERVIARLKRDKADDDLPAEVRDRNAADMKKARPFSRAFPPSLNPSALAALGASPASEGLPLNHSGTSQSLCRRKSHDSDGRADRTPDDSGLRKHVKGMCRKK